MGESSFWYRPTRVVPDQRPLNGRCCCRKQVSSMQVSHLFVIRMNIMVKVVFKCLFVERNCLEFVVRLNVVS